MNKSFRVPNKSAGPVTFFQKPAARSPDLARRPGVNIPVPLESVFPTSLVFDFRREISVSFVSCPSDREFEENLAEYQPRGIHNSAEKSIDRIPPSPICSSARLVRRILGGLPVVAAVEKQTRVLSRRLKQNMMKGRAPAAWPTRNGAQRLYSGRWFSGREPMVEKKGPLVHSTVCREALALIWSERGPRNRPTRNNWALAPLLLQKKKTANGLGAAP